MIKSMTGYGRDQIEDLGKQFTVEVKSVNHRYLEIAIRQPRQYSILEENIRKLVQQYIKRGRIEIFIKVEGLEQKATMIKVDKEIALAYYNSLKDLAKDLNVSSQIDLLQLVNLPDVITLEDKEDDLDEIWKIMRKTLVEALVKLVEMRKIEGESLQKDLADRINFVDTISVKINERTPLVLEEYREKLEKRLGELLQGFELDENRLNQELVYFADKSSITEEVIRLRSHFKQFTKSLKMDEPVGRKLDFLVQEMNREMNTIGSKANDLTIAQLVVEGKSELEKIREQIQNIE